MRPGRKTRKTGAEVPSGPELFGPDAPGLREDSASGLQGNNTSTSSFFCRTDWVIFGAIVLLAVVPRWIYLTQIADPETNPFFEAPTTDSRHYDEMAQSYAAGDWIGDGAYWYSPFYPYFLAILYSLLGRDFPSIIGLQLALGALNCGLVYLLGRVLFGRTAGVVAGVALALYRVGFFYEGLLLKAGLSLLILDLGALLLLIAALRYPAKGQRSPILPFFLSGLVLGIGSITSGTMILLAVWGGVWILLRPLPRLQKIKPALLYGTGVALAILPVTIRNAVVASDFVPVSYNAGPVFFTGNCSFNQNGSQIDVPNFLPPPDPLKFENIQEEAFFVDYAQAETGRKLRPSEVSSHWFGKGLEWVRANPAAWFRLTLKKIATFFNDFEVPNNQSFEFFRAEIAPILDTPILPTFGWIAGFGLCGMVLSLIHTRPTALLILPFFWLFAFSIILNFVVSRYRLPVIGLLAVFAGCAVARSLELARARRFGQTAAIVGSAAILTGLLFIPLPWFDHDLSDGYRILGQAQARLGQPEKAEANFEKAIAINDRSSAAHLELGLLQTKLGRESPAADRGSRFASAKENFLKALRKSPATPERQTARYLAAFAALEGGDLSDAMAIIEAGAGEEDCRLFFVRALCEHRTGEVDGAVSTIREALRLQPDYPDALLQLGRWLREKENSEEAARTLVRLLELSPDDPLAINEFLLLSHGLADPKTKEAILRIGATGLPPSADLLNELAWFLVSAADPSRRRPEEARALAEQAHHLAPTNPDILDTWAEALFLTGDRSTAVEKIDRAIDLVSEEDNQRLTDLRKQRQRFLSSGNPRRRPRE